MSYGGQREKNMIEHVSEKKWRCTIVVEKNEVYVEYCRTDILCEPTRIFIGTPITPYAYEIIPSKDWLSENTPEFVTERVREFLKRHALYERVSRV